MNPRGQVLVVNQRGNSWSLPKGHVDPGEEILEAARREIHEESGVSKLELVRKLGSYERHRISKDGKGEDLSEKKQIHMFLFRTDQDELAPTDPMNPEARWISRNQVGKMLTHPRDREFFASILDSLG